MDKVQKHSILKITQHHQNLLESTYRINTLLTQVIKQKIQN
jgi:hypothetical protein